MCRQTLPASDRTSALASSRPLAMSYRCSDVWVAAASTLPSGEKASAACAAPGMRRTVSLTEDSSVGGSPPEPPHPTRHATKLSARSRWQPPWGMLIGFTPFVWSALLLLHPSAPQRLHQLGVP